MSKYLTFGAFVLDAGGGVVNLVVDRDTDRYPRNGAYVVVTVEIPTEKCFCGHPDAPGVAHRSHECLPIGIQP